MILLVVSLVDTNVLVYCFDPTDEGKRRTAIDIVDNGLATRSLRIAHQAVIEFYAAVRKRRPSGPLLSEADATRETELLLVEFDVIFPDATIVRTAMRGMTAYGFSWYDAHMWAHAEIHGLSELLSEDLQHGRRYGGVRVIDPFR
jgi:predicted nucleic acid-binding protein